MEPERWKRIEQIYHAALEQAPARRTEFLNQACPDDPDLRREVESLLDQETSPLGFLDQPAWQRGANLFEEATVTEFAPGTRMGPYEMLDVLGAGGMGRVYKARDTRLNRLVAIKFLFTELMDDTARHRFRVETKAASSLNHPHIVTVHEAGEYEGRPYLVTELVDGGTLRGWARAEKRSWRDTAELLIGVADGLAYAHENSILHRDIKPANVLVSRSGYAKLADFGLAKMTKSETGETATLTELGTEPGRIVGTIDYMSPEQVLGEEMDARSDIFSFGVLLYEVLVGVRPFHGNSNVACMRMIVDSEPAAPSTIARGLPVSLEAIVLRCLEKKPEKRYQTARELTSELRTALNGMTASAQMSADAKRRGRRRLYAGTAVLALGAAAFLPPVRNAIGARILRRGDASADPLKTVVGGTAFDDYRAARGLLNRYDKPGNLNRALELMQAAIGKDPKYAPAYAGLSEAYIWRNTATPDPSWVALARDAAEKSISLDPDLALGHTALGYALFAAGSRPEASTAFQRATELDPKSARSFVGLAKIAAAKGNLTDADAFFQKGIELGASDWVPSLEYGIFLYNNARYADSIKACERARQLAPDNSHVLSTEAAAYYLASQYEEAVSLLQQALAIEPNARTYANIGTIRFFQGRFTDAVGPMEKAVQLQATNYLYWGNLGDAYRWAPGLRTKAGEAYSRAIALIQKNVAASPADAVLRARLAGYLAKSDQGAAALAELQRFERLSAKSGMALFKAAIAYEVAGSRDAALRSLESAVRGGYSMQEIQTDQELVNLRSDIRYQQLLARLSTSDKAPERQK